jgi:hypothetical protein
MMQLFCRKNVSIKQEKYAITKTTINIFCESKIHWFKHIFIQGIIIHVNNLQFNQKEIAPRATISHGSHLL